MVDPALALLVAYNYIRERPRSEPTGPGRPPSRTYEINPGWAPHNPQNPQNSDQAPNSEDFEDYENGVAALEPDDAADYEEALL